MVAVALARRIPAPLEVGSSPAGSEGSVWSRAAVITEGAKLLQSAWAPLLPSVEGVDAGIEPQLECQRTNRVRNRTLRFKSPKRLESASGFSNKHHLRNTGVAELAKLATVDVDIRKPSRKKQAKPSSKGRRSRSRGKEGRGTHQKQTRRRGHKSRRSRGAKFPVDLRDLKASQKQKGRRKSSSNGEERGMDSLMVLALMQGNGGQTEEKGNVGTGKAYTATTAVPPNTTTTAVLPNTRTTAIPPNATTAAIPSSGTQHTAGQEAPTSVSDLAASGKAPGTQHTAGKGDLLGGGNTAAKGKSPGTQHTAGQRILRDDSDTTANDSDTTANDSDKIAKEWIEWRRNLRKQAPQRRPDLRLMRTRLEKT